MSVSTSGFALRINGSCASNQEDCGATVNPYRVCCPESSFCPSSYNVDCCPSSANCTATLLRNPQCANQSWDLYDNGGYFCCLPGYTGYAATRTGSNGCAEPGYSFQSGEVLLKLISAGQESTSSVSSSSALSTQSTTTSSTSAASATSSSATASSTPESRNTGLSGGAIAGIVIGILGAIAIALVAGWLLWRKRKRPVPQQEINEMPAGTSQSPFSATKSGAVLGYYGSEIDSNSRRAELEEQHGTGELYDGPVSIARIYSGPVQEIDGTEIPKRA